MTIGDVAQILTQIIGYKTTYSQTGGSRGSILMQNFDNNYSICGWGSYWEIQRHGILITDSNDDVTPVTGAMAQGALKLENKRLMGFTIYDDYALDLYYEDDYTLCFFTFDVPQQEDEYKMEYWEFVNHNTKEVYFVDEDLHFRQEKYQ